ncbi:DNA methyltransferase [Phocaeicola dorei]|jgi:TYPE III RESTRICTION-MODIFICATION SYSTEM: METHYLASE|uniref:DNA methyltransferase n=1 Tax=Phocaeicola dorei TaxID=357276 RepID=UPI001F21F6E3|nr:site-specific DNA-methyltransferase [Phocaeicola dorei]MCE8762146.1 site-specific DNA-methyltransferase [Phocaeicola dorei]
MDNKNLFIELENLLRMESTYCTEDGVLLKNAIVEAALALRPELIAKLLSHDGLKRNFFTEVEGVLVFDKVKFQKFVMNKRFLPDSYTSFKNKVGLTNEDGDFLSESREVVLSWPYKDCVLEGGQTKEDVKRNEVFWNEILAPDEINRLTEPKVLTNFKRYDVDGEHEVDSISMDDNLIIKGNNLLALHSLKRKYAGKVKLIYIDPPYYFTKHKESDSFNYNSNFRLSTWLTFMHNRLSVAKELLKNGGVILCHIKEDGVHWLKVLMEEIFKVENFVETFIWKNTDNPDSLSKKSRSSVEYILCYEVNKDSSVQYLGKQTENGDAPLLNSGNSIHPLTFPAQTIRFNIPDGIYECGMPDRVEILTPIKVENGLNSNEATLKGEFKWSQQTLDEEIEKGTYFLCKTNKFSIRFQRKDGVYMAPEKYFDEQYLSKAIGVGSNEDASTHIKQMGLEFSFSKPESVVAFFIKSITVEKDIVIDFFLGSGTTAAVAHKMNRRYIGIDQMDYIENTACNRLTKVIEGEQGGISKSVNWQGGGSFVYCELAKANQQFADDIEHASSSEELVTIWEQMQETGFLSWKVNPKEINANADDFTTLAIEDQKRFLIECLDKNLLYIPYSEIDNAEFCISENDKKINNQFYQTK